jgi:molybdopterin converting factor small subunit
MLHEIVGKRSEVLKIDDSASAINLVEVISSRHGKKFQDFVFDQNGRIRSGLAFAVNGISIERSMLSKTKCRDISEFVILPPISGGNIA